MTRCLGFKSSYLLRIMGCLPCSLMRILRSRGFRIVAAGLLCPIRSPKSPRRFGDAASCLRGLPHQHSNSLRFWCNCVIFNVEGVIRKLRRNRIDILYLSACFRALTLRRFRSRPCCCVSSYGYSSKFGGWDLRGLCSLVGYLLPWPYDLQ